MPRLTIDGKESGLDQAGMADLAALMTALYGEAAARGRVLCKVVVDGREIDLAAEKELGAAPLAGIGDVDATTSTAGELLETGIAGALSLADALGADVGRAAASFRHGRFDEGLSMYMACVSSMETFFQLSGAILSGFQSGAFSLGEGLEAPSAPSTGTTEILARLLEAQRAEDWTLMADVMEYEVVPNLSEWKSYLEKLRGAQAK